MAFMALNNLSVSTFVLLSLIILLFNHNKRHNEYTYIPHPNVHIILGYAFICQNHTVKLLSFYFDRKPENRNCVNCPGLGKPQKKYLVASPLRLYPPPLELSSKRNVFFVLKQLKQSFKKSYFFLVTMNFFIAASLSKTVQKTGR